MELSKYIDHTLLKPAATQDQIFELCQEAMEYNFCSVCINPTWVSTCSDLLKDSDVKVCTVIGFPLGATTSEVKAFETMNAIQNGADEVDMVINIGALKSGNEDLVYNDIKAVCDAAGQDVLVKVIIETALLDSDEIVKACELSKKCGADFVKTSTGFNGEGAKAEDVTLMRLTVGEDMGVKASGGVRSFEDAKLMIESGATRIGASSGKEIVSGGTSESSY
ncbi:deoxyribose-phosphate aldolase [Salinicoccus roseus]|jgi:deoxyribose-phosphate aldolase|uniref:Deoxyribose-phosphate aldolase n=1 Tax=Salinicoccus roseus TaxID=45670 RepID=A0A265E9C1_9STAP|nr:deoxyribose-phosphate aldolase [Salinicoccus roseus]OZT78189.1 deoxyribose-phosphate aldolase [Salinicoccus roseus]RPE54267.1 deoxyribose-phosphate aldolase [Salinicoccus roseus]GGA66816.1 deoxyribose-phosphate aldolase [Salinicoccus roseus]